MSPQTMVIDQIVRCTEHNGMPWLSNDEFAARENGHVEAFLRAYFAHLDLEDLESRRAADLSGAAMDHARLGEDWTPGSLALRVISPAVEADGWQSPHSVVLLVTDDLPFLVDSVSMELSRLGIGIHLVVHPVFSDRRADGGGFVSTRAPGGESSPRASFIYIELDRQAGPDALAEIEQQLRRVLGDVRSAVADWPAMQAQMHEIASALADTDLPLDSGEIDEGRELLEWLARDHFTFLGYRQYELTEVGGVESLCAMESTGLGILRSRPGDTPVARPLADMAPIARERVREPHLFNITKTSSKSTVHRASYMDYVGVKTFGPDGAVTGEKRFLGLFTSEVYNHSVTNVPRVRRVVAEVLARAGYSADGHAEKRLLTILESYPRDELLQIEADELYDIAVGIAGLQERRRVRLFARPERFHRYVTAMVYLPRDRYNTFTRSAIQQLLLEEYGGVEADWSTQISESVLARTLFVVRVDNGVVNDVDVDELERRIAEMIEDWGDQFAAELVREFGEEVGVECEQRYRDAFPSAYRSAFDARTAVADVAQLEALASNGDLKLRVYRVPGSPAASFKMKLYRRGDRVSLTRVMPSLTNLGVTVHDERPYEVRPAGRERVWIYDFSLEHGDHHLDFGRLSSLVEEAFGAVWSASVADDGFNRLVLAAGMVPSDVAILRACSQYLRQAGMSFSQAYIERTLESHPRVARMLTDLFWVRFDPEHETRETSGVAIRHALAEAIDGIESLDEDRILRRFQNLIEAMLRTTFFQRDDAGNPLPYLAFKFDPKAIEDLPAPRPTYEIFVYSPRFEGVHLRDGDVARGGLRWSDRNEDYRTEVLGLVKAQMVKNAVIVPAGAKGGFVLQRAPQGDPAALREEVVACYRLFVSALLALTDNLVDNAVVSPERTVRYDRDDPYLVVAADKGTATFSDTANALAIDAGFWLGDAFASGGSHGYDHKGMGITARGAWESVRRHFRELGRNVDAEPFTAVGIGDMSGDVFGNGMLRSRHTRLVAAFDHRHVFVDPDPDPAVAYGERERMFALPRSSWADYDTTLLSEGGGVFDRKAKSVDLGERAAEALGVEPGPITPDELITAILMAPVDLLWNGGIGTYVKAADETHGDVGDKANDGIRVDARRLRCKVVGEGGNLGVTQRGRVEFAGFGGRIYTDAIDNAGGVDCSDHEVNIKILLDRVVRDGDITAKQRNELLEAMTDEVAQLVLSHNYHQTQALSVARVEATSMVDVHARYLAHLESRDLLDRSLEGLPDAETFVDRRSAGEGLTTPELAVVLAYTKNLLNDDLLASTVPDDPTFTPLLHDYFPSELQRRFPEAVESHRLRREIIANRICNLVADRAGTTMVYRLEQETSAPTHEIAAAHMAAWEIFELDELGAEINALDNVVPVEHQLAVHLAARQLAERATRWLIRNRPHPFDPGDALATFALPARETIGHVAANLAGSDAEAYARRVSDLVAASVPESLAERVAVLTPSLEALDIVEIARETGASLSDATAVHFRVAHLLDLTWLRDRILELPRDTLWTTLARLTLRGDLYADHRRLTTQAIGRVEGQVGPAERVDRWIRRNEHTVAHHRRTIAEIRAVSPADLTTVLVASREVRNLIARTTPA